MKLKGNHHLWLMLFCCLVPIATIGAIFIFNITVSTALFVGLLLLCPLLHVLMMMGMGGHMHGDENSPEVTATLTEDK